MTKNNNAPTDTGGAAAATPSPAHAILDRAPRRERHPPNSRKPTAPGRRQRVDRTLPMSEWSIDILARRGCLALTNLPESTP